MTDMTTMPQSMMTSMRANWGWLLALGIIFVVGGVFAIFAPGVASLAVTLVIAIVFAWVGIMQIIQAFSDRSWSGFVWQLIVGIVLLLGGIVVYLNPHAGAAFLTLVIAAMFIAKGVVQIVLAFRIRPHSGWGWMLASGVLAIIVGILIWQRWPYSSAWAVGTLAGISLIFTGWTYILMSVAARRLA